MKQYKVHRSRECATGEHVVDEHTVDCDCPALVVVASGPPGPAEPHMMQWSRGELERLVREFDRGYFDNDETLQRTTSMFISDWHQQTLDAIRSDPLRAVTMLLALMRFDRLTFDQPTGTLSFRVMPGRWIHLVLPSGEDGTLEVRRSSQDIDYSNVLWMLPEQPGLDPVTQDGVREQVRSLLKPRGWSPADRAIAPLVDDADVVDAVLDQLADALDETVTVPVQADSVYEFSGTTVPPKPTRALKAKRKPGAPKLDQGGAPIP